MPLNKFRILNACFRLNFKLYSGIPYSGEPIILKGGPLEFIQVGEQLNSFHEMYSFSRGTTFDLHNFCKVFRYYYNVDTVVIIVINGFL